MPEDTKDTPRLLGEISHGPSGFEQFLDRHQKGLIVVSILAALAGGGLVIYRGIQHSKEQDAAARLFKANNLAELQAIDKEFPNTAAAGSSVQQAAAIEILQTFIQANPSHPAWASAQASLGSKFLAQGKTGEASAAFQTVIDSPSGKFLAPYALTQLGDIAKLAGETDKARSLYEKANKSDYAGNKFTNGLVDQHLRNLTAKSPAEIDAPPPAPPATEDVKPANLGDLPGIMQPSPGLPAGTEESTPNDPPVAPGQ
jgi:tetratricopeptide (TPR) repeat protein